MRKNSNFWYFYRAGPDESDSDPQVFLSDEVKKKLQNPNIAEIIANCALSPLQHQPYSSFDDGGR